MNVLIHDREQSSDDDIMKMTHDETIIISDNGKIQPCICCYGCWLKTPGQCVINDGYNNMGALLSKCNQLIVISRCIYGAYSPFVKNVIDRTVCPYLLPYFKTKKGGTHHPKRYVNNITLSVHFYGEMSDSEKETARKLVTANKNNLYKNSSVSFYKSFDEIKEV